MNPWDQVDRRGQDQRLTDDREGEHRDPADDRRHPHQERPDDRAHHGRTDGDPQVVTWVIGRQTGQQGPYVFVVKADSTVESRPVTVGRKQGGHVVIAKGLSADERVVTDGQLRLSPGVKVEVKPSAEVRS